MFSCHYLITSSLDLASTSEHVQLLYVLPSLVCTTIGNTIMLSTIQLCTEAELVSLHVIIQ